jgi:hypothetical protein
MSGYFSDPVAVLEHLLAGRPVDRKVLSVVGECDIPVASGDSRLDHLHESGAAVAGPIGVVVEVAEYLGPLDQMGKAVVCRQLHLAGAFPDYGWHPGHFQRPIDVFLGLRRNDLVFFEKSVFTQQPAAVDCTLAESDVVGL